MGLGGGNLIVRKRFLEPAGLAEVAAVDAVGALCFQGKEAIELLAVSGVFDTEEGIGGQVEAFSLNSAGRAEGVGNGHGNGEGFPSGLDRLRRPVEDLLPCDKSEMLTASRAQLDRGEGVANHEAVCELAAGARTLLAVGDNNGGFQESQVVQYLVAPLV